MNRRAFLTAVGITPILGSAFKPLRAQTAGGRLLYVGTYTNNAAGSKGLYGWRFDAETGKVTSLGLAAETDSPSWVVVHPNKRFLYAANELPPPRGWRANRGRDGILDRCRVGQADADRPRQDEWPGAGAHARRPDGEVGDRRQLWQRRRQ